MTGFDASDFFQTEQTVNRKKQDSVQLQIYHCDILLTIFYSGIGRVLIGLLAITPLTTPVESKQHNG